MWRVTGDKQVDDQAMWYRCEILRLYVIVRTEHAYSYYTDEKRQLLAVYCHFDFLSHDTIQYDTIQCSIYGDDSNNPCEQDE
jgi:hypothetical protein